MALRFDPISEAEYQTPCRGTGQLYDGAVASGTGVDFTLTRWSGQMINVDVSEDCLACWGETSPTFTTATERSAAGTVTLTVGFKLLADQRNEFVVPISDLSTPVVLLKIAAVSTTSTVTIDRASVLAKAP